MVSPHTDPGTRSEAQASLGRYRLGVVIGSGGMGTVLSATDEVLGRQVALKVLREDLAGDDRALARFRQEARIAASLSHPGIAAVYDFAEEEGRQAIVMELLDGHDLHSVRQLEGRLQPAVVATLLAEAADALAYAHGLGAVHRDIKPANIFLTRTGTVKITDFGVAYAGGAGLTTTGALVGTPDYLAPEQVRGERATAASDLYSLGCVAFELLCGQPPFGGDNSIAVATARLDAPAPSPRAFNPAVGEALDAVVRCALDPVPERRFPSATAMAQALRAAAHAGPRPATPAAGTVPLDVAGLTRQLAMAPAGLTQQLGASPATMVDLPAAAVLWPPFPGGPIAPVGPAGGPWPPAPARRRHSRWTWLWLPVIVLLMAGITFDIVAAWRKETAAVVVPTWTNASFQTASAAAQRLGLHVTSVPTSSLSAAGTVLSSNPAAGSKVKRGHTVSLAVSLGNLFREDNVVNDMQDQAMATLQGQNLNPVVSAETVAGSVDGQVVSQDPPATTAVARGATVTLTVTAAPQSNGDQSGNGDSSSCGGLLSPLLNLFSTCAAPSPSPTAPAHRHKGGGGGGGG
jgi:hypothetical protein